MRDMNEMTRRPDRRVDRVKEWTRIVDSEPGRLLAVAQRSREGYLTAYTVPVVMETHCVELEYEDGARRVGHVARRPWIEGRCPVQPAEMYDVLFQLHKEVRTGVPERELQDFYDERWQRVLRRADRHKELVHSVVPWKTLVDPTRSGWGSWHGDATVFNAVRTPGGRIVLIDHSHRTYGPQRYDYGKLALSCLWRGNDPRSILQSRMWAGYWPEMFAALAGMIGDHCDDGRNPELPELLRRLHREKERLKL